MKKYAFLNFLELSFSIPTYIFSFFPKNVCPNSTTTQKNLIPSHTFFPIQIFLYVHNKLLPLQHTTPSKFSHTFFKIKPILHALS